MRRAAAAALAAALGAASGGCVTLAMLRPLPCACPGALLPVAAMGEDFSAQARYRVRSRGREQALLLAAEKRGDRLVLLGFDPLGTALFSLVQVGDAAPERERHLRPLFPFAPENVLRDFERARFADPLAPRDGDARIVAAGEGVEIERPACDWHATLTPVPEQGRSSNVE